MAGDHNHNIVVGGGNNVGGSNNRLKQSQSKIEVRSVEGEELRKERQSNRSIHERINDVSADDRELESDHVVS
jgi:hypothetical protein